MAGHTLDDDYSLELGLAAADRQRAGLVKEVVAIGGGRETLYQRDEVTWSVVTVPIASSSLAAVREFLDSVEGGESFTFDAYGTIAVPDNPVTVYRIPGPIAEQRAIKTGSGAGDYRAFAFAMVEA